MAKRIPGSGQLKASIISSTRGSKMNETCSATSVTSINASTNFFKCNATMPNSTGAATNRSFSDFRNAAVVTGTIFTRSESSSTYNDANDGSFTTTIDPSSVVSGGYNFRFGSGAWVEQSTNSRTINGLDSGNYTTCIRDGLNNAANQSVVAAVATVGLADGDRRYCFQRGVIRVTG